MRQTSKGRHFGKRQRCVGRVVSHNQILIHGEIHITAQMRTTEKEMDATNVLDSTVALGEIRTLASQGCSFVSTT